MRRVPKKNISRLIADVRQRGGSPESLPSAPDRIKEFYRAASPEGGSPRVLPSLPRRTVAKVLAVFLAACAVTAGAVFFVRWRVAASAGSGGAKLRRAVSYVQSLDFADASSSLSEARDLFATASPGGFDAVASAVGRFIPVVQDSVTALKDVQEIAVASAGALAEFQNIATNGPGEMLRHDGDAVMASLNSLRGALALIQGKVSELNTLGVPAGGDRSEFLGMSAEISRYQKLLDALTAWLGSPTPRHVALLFENSSELRPGGGFVGSFADVAVRGGQVDSVEVLDIGTVDATTVKKRVPPKPLQAVIGNWRSADMNWFFDFPKSAAKTLAAMEDTGFYASRGENFDAAVAVTPRVVGDILAATGPVTLGGTTVDEKNFVDEIQRDVQKSQARGETDTKTFLARLVPLLLDRLATSTSLDGQFWLRAVPRWVAAKEALVYFKDGTLQSFADFAGASGGALKLPATFNGDYLGFAEANIGGQKSDRYITKDLFFQSRLLADGTLADHVEITFAHGGNKAKEWWYRAPFRGYFMLYTSPGAVLTGASGAWRRAVSPKANYATGNWWRDPDVVAVESTEKIDFNFPAVSLFGDRDKNVFGFWFKVNPGATSTAALDYTGRAAFAPAAGREYSFVFERQPGWTGLWSIEVQAPVGFVWAENSSPVFDARYDALPGRLILTLTLQKTP